MPLGNLVAGTLAVSFTAPRVLVLDGLVLVTVGAVVLLRHSGAGITSL